MKSKKGAIDVLNLIIGFLIMFGGLIYIFNVNWGLLIVAISLALQALREVI